MPSKSPLVVVAGPTGSGKSSLALRIAQHLDAEIVNCDSLQLYRGFDAGTAKTPPLERRGIPHHLLGDAGRNRFIPREIMHETHGESWAKLWLANGYRWSPEGPDSICARSWTGCLYSLRATNGFAQI